MKKFYNQFRSDWQNYIYKDKYGKWIFRIVLILVALFILSLLGYLIIDNIIESDKN